MVLKGICVIEEKHVQYEKEFIKYLGKMGKNFIKVICSKTVIVLYKGTIVCNFYTKL